MLAVVGILLIAAGSAARLIRRNPQTESGQTHRAMRVRLMLKIVLKMSPIS
jgi:hypothetical protein